VDLGIAGVHSDEAYAAKDWLFSRKEAIEKALVTRYLGDGSLVCDDLSSSWVEGCHNELAAFGHARDGRCAKRQINYGVVASTEGFPVRSRGSLATPRTRSKGGLQLASRAAPRILRQISFAIDCPPRWAVFVEDTPLGVPFSPTTTAGSRGSSTERVRRAPGRVVNPQRTEASHGIVHEGSHAGRCSCGVWSCRSLPEAAMAALGLHYYRHPCRLRVLGEGHLMHSEQAFLVGETP